MQHPPRVSIDERTGVEDGPADRELGAGIPEARIHLGPGYNRLEDGQANLDLNTYIRGVPLRTQTANWAGGVKDRRRKAFD